MKIYMEESGVVESAEERWKQNFLVKGPFKMLVVQVIAAENNGWRAEVGYSNGGMVIEDPKQTFKSTWAANLEAVTKIAKSMARQHKIKWKPGPYGKQ